VSPTSASAKTAADAPKRLRREGGPFARLTRSRSLAYGLRPRRFRSLYPRVGSGDSLAGMSTAPRVTLREITAETVIPVCRLSVRDDQRHLVEPNAVSLAQALFSAEAWYRAVYDGEDLAGFIMLEDQSLRVPLPSEPAVSVWRFMIDRRFQGRGIGRAALLQVIEHVRRKQIFAVLQLSYRPRPYCAEPFYVGLGFRHTGRMDGEEVVLELPLG
jgi:diamine N-acetyltransferase